jgi:nucleoside-diphosphate-sugar epimerase
MIKSLREFRWKESVPRLIADFAIVQMSAACSLLGVFLWRIDTDHQVDAFKLAGWLREFYFTRFLPLSLIFPLVFLLFGFYTTLRLYQPEYKRRVVLRGATMATLIFLFVNFMVARSSLFPRSAVLIFVVLVNAGAIGARRIKDWLVANNVLGAAPAYHPARAGAPVLIVGGAGYIGSVLCRKLLAAGERVRVLDSLLYGDSAIRELMSHPNFELIAGDCRNIQSVVSSVHGAGSIVHLAAIVGDPACEQARQSALEINYAATRMMIEIAKGAGVERFLFASSCSVYGATDSLMTEESFVNPISVYAHTKVDSENALLRERSNSFHPTVLRLATVFGLSYRPRFDLVVNFLAGQAYYRGVITIYNGQQWRPFIHVDDVAEGLIQVLRAPVPLVSGEVFNLGDSGLNHTLAQLAEHIRVVFPNTQVQNIENIDKRNYRVSFDKIRNMVGFQCRKQLDDGIQELKAAFEQGLVKDHTDPLYHNQKFLQGSGDLSNLSEVDEHVMAAFSQALPHPSAIAARAR